MENIYVGPSRATETWNIALYNQDSTLLAQLVENEPSGVSLFHLATYINGLYRVTQHPLAQVLPIQIEDVRAKVERVLPTIRAIRRRLGWKQREVDIGLMRWIRRSSALSVVIGAGVTQAAGGPSWSELVRLLLEVALKKGHEVTEMVPTSESSPEPPARFLPDESIVFGEDGTWEYERRIIRVERFKSGDEAEARNILALIKEHGTSTNTEELMRGAQLCYDLFDQHLFTHLTQILYSCAPKPGPIHRVVAELAHGQEVSDRGPGIFPGWDSIITYNFDALMSEALDEQQVPHAALAMRAGQIVGDPDELAQESDWSQPVLHLHGYTPRRLFRITDVEFVFSTAQYLRTYSDKPQAIIDAALDQFLANPVHYALYVGCSFNDEEMNGLLREATQRYPGRLHYALLKWPKTRGEHEPTLEEIEEHSERYLDIGVQPVWIYDFAEIPEVIRSLK